MKVGHWGVVLALKVLCLVGVAAPATQASCQVSPTEVLGPKARADEQTYMPKLQSLHKTIAAASFPYPFNLARYVNAKSGRAAADFNGLEFVSFQHRVVLKVSGIYHVVYDASSLSENMRADRTFQGAVIPLLRMVADKIPRTADCDGLGFEIVYGTRDIAKAYEFEGREALSVVFSMDDAYAFLDANEEEGRQAILNRAEVFLNGNPFLLALGRRDSLDRGTYDEAMSPLKPEIVRVETSGSLNAVAPLTLTPKVEPSGTSGNLAEPSSQSGKSARLESMFRSRLLTLANDEGRTFHLEDGVEPSFEDDKDEVYLHFTMRNPRSFDGTGASIYKKAAQDFDLFLATELKELLKRVPVDAQFDALKLSVLDNLGGETKASEEIVYICPLKSTRMFVQDRMTSQDLINQSVVLVNGVRIGLNLAAVE